MGKPTMKTIELAGETFNAEWLRTHTEQQAVRTLQGYDHNQVRNVWKQANGLSVRNHSREGMIEELVKSNRKPELEKLANEMGIEFETDANKPTIAALIVDKQLEGKA